MKTKLIAYFTVIFLIVLTVTGYNQMIKAKTEKFEQNTQRPIIRSLLELTAYEDSKLGDFRQNYEDKTLKDLDPLSVCKMYLYSALIGDYETQYELYTTNEGYVMWSKEEDLAFPKKDRIKDFEKYKDVHDIEVKYGKNYEEEAIISWSSENGYVDEEHGPWNYEFRLIKDGDIWKVSFMPMQ